MSSLPFGITVSSSLLAAIVMLLKEFASDEGQFLTNLLIHQRLGAAAARLDGAQPGYAVVIAAGFSALLQVDGQPDSAITLSFEPTVIAQFVAGRSAIGPAVIDPNTASRQTEFTQRLMHLLVSPLQDQAATLEQIVAARTQALRDALLAAQAADVAKSEFLATMSHELRTPLTCIIGMSATLLRNAVYETISAERRQAHLQIIHDRGAGLLALINDILELANIEAGRIALNMRSFHLCQLANQTLQEMIETAQPKQVNLVLDLLPGMTSADLFYADPQRVRQILLNLLNNAVKFTLPGGQVTLRVRLMWQSAIFQVEDTGIGIALEHQPLIFQKFQQLDSSYQRNYEGAGLGLALTKQLVELHGGKIEFMSQVDVGSVFTVTLPRRSIDPIDAPTAMSVDPVYIRVMLVEAIEEQAAMVCDLLTVANCQVVWMTDLEMVLYQLDAAKPHIVIVNCGQVDSPTTLTNFRQALLAAQIKFLAVLPEDAAIADYHDLMADDYLVATIGAPELLVDKVMQLTTTAAMSEGLSIQ